MLSSSGSSRPLNELSHEETKQLLLGLGCDAFNDECDFIQSKMTGSDLAEVESSDDLLECGVIAKKLRIKSIFTKLMTYKESGVPESSLSSQLLPTNIVQNVANLTVSSDSTAAVTAPAPPAAPAPIAPVVSSNEEGPVFPPMRNREQTESLISKFVKEYSTSITNQVLECAYTAYFHPRPNDAALEWWTKAYLEREKVIDTLDKSTQNKHHKEANRCIEEALKADFWLPFRHACLWNYQGNTPSVIFRIEYDALRDSFQSMEREGHKLSDNQMEIKRKIDNIFNELSWSDGDGFRLSICRSGAHAKEGAGCIAGCLKLADSTSYYCCANHFQIPTNFTRGQSTTWGERRDIYQLCSLPLQEWDPCVSFYSVVNWPAPDNIRTTNYDLRTIWRGGKGEKKKYFLQHSSICSKFALFPQVFLNSNSTLFGSVTQNMNTIDKLDLGNVFKELIQVRNRFVGHGTVTFNAEDLWWTFTMVLIAAHIGNQQATFWTNTYEGMKNPVAQLPYYPTFDACKKLRDGTQLICSKLLQDDEVIKSNINLQLETDTYQEFVDSVNKFRQRESFQILLIPPLPCEFIPSSLAAVPWDLVVDFADIGSATLPTESTAWKLMKEASSQNGAIKPTHKVSYNPSHIFRKQTDLLCSYLEEINPVHIPWWQITAATDSGLLSPLFDADGLKRDAQTVDDVMDSINSVVQHIFQTRVLRNRSVQIVLPMYGVCEIPCQNATSKRWFFRNTYSSFPSSVDRNYATPYFLRQILRSLTIDPKVVVKCTVLFQLDNSLASIEMKKNFLSAEDTGLRTKCPPKLLYLPIDVMLMRYRLSFMDDDEGAGNYGDALCIYSHKVLVPFANWRDERVDIGVQNIQAESHENIAKLNKCGIDILHNQSAEHSLREFESKSFFSMLLNNQKKTRGHTSTRSITKHALAVLKFYFSYPPAWALFCEDTMKEDGNLHGPFVVSRKALMSTLVKKATILRESRTSNNTLIVSHQSRSGGTTLVRKFAWEVAFKEWNAVVLSLDDRFNSVGPESFREILQILRNCLEAGSDLIIIADRNILNEPLKRLCDGMKQLNLHFLLIRLQRLSGSKAEESQTPASLTFQTYGKVETLIIDPDGKENKKEIEKDMEDVVGCMFRIASYFDPNIDIHAAREKYRKHGDMDHRFKKIFFLGLLRFVETSDQILHHDISQKNVYNTVVSKWMEDVVGMLYQKIAKEDEQAAPGGFSTSAAVRALMYIAIIQLCTTGSTRLDINSLRIVFNDSCATLPLFTVWEDRKIEQNVMHKAYLNAQRAISNVSHSNFSPTMGSMLPFLELNAETEEMKNLAVDAWKTFNESKEESKAETSFEQADLSAFPLFRQFNAVKGHVQHAVYEISGPNAKKKPIVDDYASLVRDNISNVSELLVQLLFVSKPPNDGQTADHVDRLDDVSDMLYGEFLNNRDGMVGFVSNDVAEIFLQEALKCEVTRYRNQRRASTEEITQLQSNSTQLYILTMLLLNTISNDRRTMDHLKSNSFVDINHEEKGGDTSLAWCAQHIFISKQFLFEKESPTSNNYNKREHTADTIGYNQEEALRNGSPKYLSSFQKWSWLLVKIQSYLPVPAMLENGSYPAFQTPEMKLLIASQAVYSGYWRLSSTGARLMQYHSLRLAVEISQMRLRMESNAGISPFKQTESIQTWLQLMYAKGIQLYLASSARLILAVDEINRTPKLMSNSEGDRKKVSGTMDQLGNCIKAFICINREVVHMMFTQQLSSLTPPSTMRSTKFYGCSACLLVALGNMARYFYGLSIRIVSQPLGFGDEVDSWLHVLGGLQALQKEASNHHHTDIIHLDHISLFPALITQVMELYCGERDAQWIKGAGPILSSGGSSISFDSYFGRSTYFSTHLYATHEIQYEIHSKLEDFNDANLRMLEEKNTDFSYFDQNVCREDNYIVRLAGVAAGAGQFKNWRHLFDEHVRELDQLPPTHELVPFKERSIARFAQCMWQQEAIEEYNRSNRENMVASKVFHHFFVQVNQDAVRQATVEKVVHCIIDCMTKLVTKYPLRLMTQLFELLSFASVDSIVNVANACNGDMSSFPYSVELLLPIVEKWEGVARFEFASQKCDETSVGNALRFRVILTFILLWKYAANRRHQNIYGQEKGEDIYIKFMNEYNGYFDASKGEWIPGLLANHYKSYVHYMDRYVFVHPIQFPTTDFDMYGISLCMRKQFSIIDEGAQEKKWNSAEERRYCMQLVHGEVKRLTLNEKKSRYEGVVKLQRSQLTLTFYYDNAAYEILQAHGSSLTIDHPCTFYITFLPWRVEAHAVQCSEKRVPLDTLYVGEDKLRSVAKSQGKREQQLRRADEMVHSIPAPTPQAAPAPVASLSSINATPVSASQKNSNNEEDRKATTAVLSVNNGETTRNKTGWVSGKALVLQQDPTVAAQDEALVKAKYDALPEGVSVMTLFNKSKDPSLISSHNLDSPSFASLRTFKAGEGTVLRQTTIADLYGSEAAQVLSGEHFDQDGFIRPPRNVVRNIYGNVTFKKVSKESNTTNKHLLQSSNPEEYDATFKKGPTSKELYTPYKHLLQSSIPEECGVILIPNHVVGERCCLPCSDDTNYVGIGGTEVKARIRLLVNESATLLFNSNSKVTAFGDAEPLNPLNPQIPKVEVDDAIPTSYNKLHHRLYLLWHIHTMSLMAIREGLLVLVTDLFNDGKQDWSRLSLGVVYFPESAPAANVVEEIRGTWQRSKELLNECRLSDHFDMNNLMAPRRVKFTSFLEQSQRSIASTEKNTTKTPVLVSKASTSTVQVAGVGQNSKLPSNAAKEMTRPNTGAAVHSIDPIFPSSTTTTTPAQTSASQATAKAVIPPKVIQNNTATTKPGSVKVSQPSFKASPAPKQIPVKKQSVASSSVFAAFDDDSEDEDEDEDEGKDNNGSESDDSTSVSTIPAASLSSAAKSTNPQPIVPLTRSSTNEDSWSTVQIPKAQAKPKAVPLGSCTLGLKCLQGPDCPNGPHPAEVQRVFDKFQSSRERQQYKFQLCTYATCPNGAERCFLYHDKDSRERRTKFCVKCLESGHLSNACKKK